MRTLLLLAVLLPGLALGQEPAPPANPPPPQKARDQVYKWVDDKGVVHYTDKPPSDGARPTTLPPLQTYKGGTNPDLNRFDKPVAGKPAGAAQAALLDVVTPSHDETFRGGERTVPVAVVVTPPLDADQRLIYMLNGTPQNTPTSDTSFAFTNVDRGTHTASVVLVDAAGNTLATSSTVTFHMKPPIAGQADKFKPKPPAKPPAKP
jgi:hypothetical protein